jgi:hypothetical protein
MCTVYYPNNAVHVVYVMVLMDTMAQMALARTFARHQAYLLLPAIGLRTRLRAHYHLLMTNDGPCPSPDIRR